MQITQQKLPCAQTFSLGNLTILYERQKEIPVIANVLAVDSSMTSDPCVKGEIVSKEL